MTAPDDDWWPLVFNASGYADVCLPNRRKYLAYTPRNAPGAYYWIAAEHGDNRVLSGTVVDLRAALLEYSTLPPRVDS
jgi:hypothetical protein